MKKFALIALAVAALGGIIYAMPESHPSSLEGPQPADMQSELKPVKTGEPVDRLGDPIPAAPEQPSEPESPASPEEGQPAPDPEPEVTPEPEPTQPALSDSVESECEETSPGVWDCHN